MASQRRLRSLHIALGAAFVMAITLAIALRKREPRAECGPGFLARPPRCLGCAAPLQILGSSCKAPDVRVHIPETTLTVGSSDWEAEGRVAARSVHVTPFMIDAFEATVADFDPASKDGARAAGSLSRGEAIAYCTSRGGRLPTEDEWLAAAAAAAPTSGGEDSRFRRYPWGDTGAVCRRAAWGLEAGPCAHGASGPDTVGAHPDGDTPTGIHDLAGNVAEWVAGDTPAGLGVVRGGSYRSALATELRTWSRREIPVTAKEPDVGVRCAYDGGLPRR